MATTAAQDLPRRVAMVVSHDVPGGAQLLWEQIATQFRARGIDVALIAIQSRAEDEDTSWSGMMDGKLTPLNMPRALWRLRQELLDLRPCMIISALPASNILAPLAGRLAGVPVRVISHHSPVSTHQPLLRYLDRVVGATGAVSKVVCVSQAVRDSISDYGASYLDKVEVIRNAVPPPVLNTLKRLARARDDVPAGRTARIVAAGRLADQKNYPTLLRAMARVRRGHLSIIGDGPDATALKALATSLNLDGKVTFVGRLNHVDTLSLMSQADIFVQPSLYEGHSLALIEAATLGLPMVLSDIPTQTEAVVRPGGNTHAIVVPALDDVAIGDAVNSLIETPGEIGRYSSLSLQIAGDFRFEDTVDAYLRLWSGSKARNVK